MVIDWSDPAVLGREIRRRRLALNMTLDELGARSRLTPNYIGTIENGLRDPSVSTLCAIARGLGISASELFGCRIATSAMATEAGKMLDAVPPELQALILALLRFFVRRRPPRYRRGVKEEGGVKEEE
jgi:transcriptional regulator with XRE-family HTH domain